MTVGKDVSSLLADVVKNGQTANLELKKLVYLYLINYAKSAPDLAILAVNTFVKDSQDPNPLIRALAVRTMGCIRVDKITEYLCDPLLKTLRDEDPYVRKTAAICVAKLYDINPELVEERGFLELLRDLLGDANPMVVANAVAALTEIADTSGRPEVFTINTTVLYKLLAALNECTEWGQVFILDALAGYTSTSVADAEMVVERVTPRLQHANCAVVLSSVKVVLKQLPLLSGNTELLGSLRKKLAPPLVTLLSSEPEIQYVALRNLSLIIQRYPSILGSEVKVFFCKYNDPLYVKMEKLEILVRLASERNVDALLLEWREYATEVDVDFVRKSVRCVGRAAIALEGAAERCVNVLLELIQTKVNYVVQEAVVVIRDIFRRYPGRYEGVIGTLCECLDTLDEPEAKASMIWIVGEYAERIDNAEELLSMFAETFDEEAQGVQLALLTACVKLFLKRPEPGPQALIQGLLSRATTETDNPDLRDRAYIYWRLLSSDPEAARDVVLAEKPVISDDSASLEPQLLDELLGQLATLAAVYHKPASAFVSRARVGATVGVGLGGEDEGGMPQSIADASPGSLDILGGLSMGGAVPPPPQAPPPQSAAPRGGADMLGDLMSLGSPAPAARPQQPPASSLGGLDDLLGGLGVAPAAPAAASATPSLPLLLPAEQAAGLQICGALRRSEAGEPVLHLTFQSQAGMPLDGFQLQFNSNLCGLAAAAPLSVAAAQPGGPPVFAQLPLGFTGAPCATGPQPNPGSWVVNAAVKSPRHPPPSVFYFNLPLTAEHLFRRPTAPFETAQIAGAWRALPEGPTRMSSSAVIRSAEEATALLARANVFVVHNRPLADGAFALYAGALLPPNLNVALELTTRAGGGGVRLSARSASGDAAQLAVDAVERLLC